MDAVAIIAATMGVAWASGLNLYATILTLGYLGYSGTIELPPNLAYIENPPVIIAAGVMYAIEFFIDKTPGVDSVWDTLHSFVRIPGGAILAAAAITEISPELQLIGALLGGVLAASSHFTKSGSRILINSSPEPISNWIASLTEDVLAIGAVILALHNPLLFLVLLGIVLVLITYLLPRIWRGIKLLIRRIRAIIKKWYR